MLNQAKMRAVKKPAFKSGIEYGKSILTGNSRIAVFNFYIRVYPVAKQHDPLEFIGFALDDGV